MPVYEQKLICPFAVRFTQEHIRTTFRDGRLVEDSFREIEVLPGTQEYDLILKAPFPNIEIIRWSHPCEGSSFCCMARREKGDCSHWFTLDNRRLYCLQRAAAVHWPRRVGVAVDLLYAEPGRVWRKCDSTTHGKTVSIGHSCKGPEIGRWDWMGTVLSASPPVCAAVDAALHSVQQDDARASVAELLDAPGEAGSLLTLLQSEVPLEQLLKVSPGGYTPSTMTPPDDSDGSEATETTSEEVTVQAVKRGLEGVWYGGEGETYRFRFGGESSWTCIRQGTNGTRNFTVTYDPQWDAIWWGTAWSYYFIASQVAEEPDEIKLYAAQDVHMRRPKFVWHRRGCGPAAAAGAGSDVAEAAEGGQKAKPFAAPGSLEAAALAEAEEQLADPSNEGYVRISDWNERYAEQLGSLRSFLQRHPERFAVTPGRGGRFTVVLVAGAARAGSGIAPKGGRTARGGGAGGRRSGGMRVPAGWSPARLAVGSGLMRRERKELRL